MYELVLSFLETGEQTLPSILVIPLPYTLWNYNQLPWANSPDLNVINQIGNERFKVMTQREQKNSQFCKFKKI